MASSTLTERTYPPLLTKKQTAELYATTPRSLDRWLASGIIPAAAKKVIGGSVRFRTSILMDHINGAAESQLVEGVK